MSDIKIQLPDLGVDGEVEVIEILVKAGDKVKKDEDLITLESDKATMGIPSTHYGVIKSIDIKVGSKVKSGDAIGFLTSSAVDKTDTKAAAPETVKTSDNPSNFDYDLVVIGSGPGGYTAAFRAADLGKKVALIEAHQKIGGVCLNVGCIPSKALLHLSVILNETKDLGSHGISFAEPKIDLTKIVEFKNSVINKLTGGLDALAKQRKVEILQGYASFTGKNELSVDLQGKKKTISFANAIIATGSSNIKIPGIDYEDARILDSTSALELKSIPEHLLVIGCGIIGLEMAQVYNSLGAKVTMVDMADNLIPAADKDITRPLLMKLKKKYENIFFKTSVKKVQHNKKSLKVEFDGAAKIELDEFDKILVAVGRTPNSKNLGLDKAGVKVSERGFIEVDKSMRTNVENIFAIGDVVGQPMLAHKATHEAKVAAEVICGHSSTFEPLTIPSVAYTDPEIAWAGKTEEELKKANIDYEVGQFPWEASGRSLSLGRNEGKTKALFDTKTKRLLGVGIVGSNAGELIAEAVVAMEMGADMQDLALSIHPHPTLSETLGLAAEMAEGTITDLMPIKKRK